MTGAASGIGKAVVRRLLRESVDVLAVDINAGGLDDVSGAGCEIADGRSSPTRRPRPSVADRRRRRDYLVNAAGIIVSSRSSR